MRRIILLLAISALLLAACAEQPADNGDIQDKPDFADDTSYIDATIILERGGMFTLPELGKQIITITHEGVTTEYYHYNGSFTKSETKTFTGNEYAQLLDAIEDNSFFELDSEYNSEVPIADVGFGVITVQTPAETKTVRVDPYIGQGNSKDVAEIIDAIYTAQNTPSNQGPGNPIDDDGATDIIHEETFTMQYQPMQCEGTPWNEWYESGAIQFIKAPTQLELVQAYYNLSQIVQLEHEMVCEACSVCPAGEYYQAEVVQSQIAKYTKLGWELLDPVACTKELKICPDGTGVGRNSSFGCEFNACPGE